MRPALSALILTLFMLSLPVGSRGQVLADLPQFPQAATTTTETALLQADQTTASSSWHLFMKGVAKRSKGAFASLSVPPLCMTDPDPHPFVHTRSSPLATVHQATLLYQTLQVLRF
jgi:hypothetical protein